LDKNQLARLNFKERVIKEMLSVSFFKLTSGSNTFQLSLVLDTFSFLPFLL
jgi:hypothetical protein